MVDQAHRLRSLVRGAMPWMQSGAAVSPWRVVVQGGEAEVGTTTLAINLAAAMAQQGRRVLLVDANLVNPSIGAMCHIDRQLGLADSMLARRTIHEVIGPGPAGMQLITGIPADVSFAWTPLAQHRFMQQISSLGRHIDIVIADVGFGVTDYSTNYWSEFDQVLLVSDGGSSSIMETYATIKLSQSRVSTLPPLGVIVNRATSPDQARSVYARLATSSDRFLRLQVDFAGHVPLDPALAKSSSGPNPVVVTSPTCETSKSIESIATTLATNVRQVNEASARQAA